MPDQAVDVIGRAATQILDTPAIEEKFREAGFNAQAVPPDLLDQRMRSEIMRWASVIADAGIAKQ
jgi:tripartite-type tricarboxylate transporter receptor subunit TctC